MCYYQPCSTPEIAFSGMDFAGTHQSCNNQPVNIEHPTRDVHRTCYYQLYPTPGTALSGKDFANNHQRCSAI